MNLTGREASVHLHVKPTSTAPSAVRPVGAWIDGGEANGKRGRMGTRIWIRRAYDAPTDDDGHRVLVDRVWPRGVARDQARIDEWLREVAPSTGLRRWFGHDPDRWEEFRSRYRQELADSAEQIDRLLGRARRGRVTLVYGARDEKRNNAVVLREYLEERLG